MSGPGWSLGVVHVIGGGNMTGQGLGIWVPTEV